MPNFIQPIEGSQQTKELLFQYTENKKLSHIKVHLQKFSLSQDLLARKGECVELFSLYDRETGLLWWQLYSISIHEKCNLENDVMGDYGYLRNDDGIFRPYEQPRGFRKKFLYISEEKLTSFLVDSQGFFLIDALKSYGSFEEGFNHFMISVNNNLQNDQDWFEGDQNCQYIDFTNVLLEEIIPITEEKRLCSAIRRDTRITPDIVKVKRRKNKWYVFLERAYKKQALVVLNDDYQAIKALGEGAKKTA
ncbi:MAG: hypothetical protein DRR16_31250 [Candidatus Parabeggiatoa sp. nov. 3]|nr:MAG: hypothetical protein DRR00_33035 [Gammaproteobacteria bacterium]RKZ75479.1 MAG: hypothetical protein DRR16_31250 [Gammaproteobacteria bacterium]